MKYNSNVIDLTNLENIQNLYFVGDIHGQFAPFGFNVKTKIENSIIVIAGDIGLGFHKPEYYEQEFAHLHGILKNKNCYVVFVRGNHDDPKWFSHPDWFSQQIANEMHRIIIADDYDIVQTQFGNVLCIGGAISVDRSRRELNKDWGQDEGVKPLDIDTFNKLHQHTIDIVVSHSSPDMCFPIGVGGSVLNTYANYDKNIKADCRLEREMLTNIYEHLVKDWRIKDWFYGHFHYSYYDIQDYYGHEVKFHGLDCHEFKQFNVTLESCD